MVFSSSLFRLPLLHLAMAMMVVVAPPTMAWLSSPISIWSKRHATTGCRHRPGPVFLSASPEDQPPLLRRASVEGVSLSPNGFWVILNVPELGYLPLQITTDPQDARAATSAEALTVIQLLSGVDMAGAILPPDVLARMVVQQCDEDVLEEEEPIMDTRIPMEVRSKLLEQVSHSLPNGTTSYSDAHPWFQSRIPLPQVSLDELQIDNKNMMMWTVSVRHVGSFAFCPSEDVIASTLYQYTTDTSRTFCSLALALRYKAPISVAVAQSQQDNVLPDLPSVQDSFPMFATRSQLQQSSTRVQENIVRGFEIHKLSGALRIAMERGDHQAAEKIRQKLDEYDTMDQLPTVQGMSDNQYNNTYYELGAMQ